MTQVAVVARPHGKTLRAAVILRIGQLKDDRAIVRHRLEYDANANEIGGLRKLDNLLTLTIVELEKHL
ncbi:MAG: hypothetical protein WC426_13445 [Sulfuriferula sp.]